MKKRKETLFGYYCINAFLWIGCNLHHPYEPTFYVAQQMPSRIFGLAFAAMSLTAFLCSPMWGRLCDRRKIVKTIAVSSILYGAAQVLMGFARTEWQVLLARALAGCFYAGFTTALIAFIPHANSTKSVLLV